MAPQGDLVRVVLTEDGGLAVGRSLPGRGAWLCAGSPSCVDMAERRKALPRALHAAVTPEAVGALRLQLRERARIEDCVKRSRED